MEFDYTNGAWSGQVIDSSDGSPARNGMGDVQRDGFASLYFAVSVPGGSRLDELRWRRRSWTRTELDRIPLGTEGRRIIDIAVGDARHDGIDRIYLLTYTQGAFGPWEEDITEYNVGRSNWERTVIAHLTAPSGDS